MTNVETTDTVANVGAQVAHGAHEKPASKKQASPKTARAEGQRTAKGGKAKAVPKKPAKIAKKAAKADRVKASGPESKQAEVLEAKVLCLMR